MVLLGMAGGISDFGLAQTSKVSIAPSAGSFSVDSTFDVSVFVDTEGSIVNVLDIWIKFPPDKLQVINPSANTSIISLWLQQPVYSNKDGTIPFIARMPEKHNQT